MATAADPDDPPDGADAAVEAEEGAGIDALRARVLAELAARLMAVLVVKLGSSTLVGPGGRLRDDVLEARVRDLVRVRRQGHHPVLVTSGAIACGMGRLGMAERAHARSRPPGRLGGGAGGAVPALRGGVRAPRRRAGPDPAHLARPRGPRAPTSTRARRCAACSTSGAVPVINENDTTATDELTFGDNDVLAAQVAILLGAAWLLLLTERDGLYAATAPRAPS